MMEKVSTDFIVGFIIDNALRRIAKNKETNIGVSIPNLWILGKAHADNHGVLCLAATESCNIITTDVVYYLRKMFPDKDIDCEYSLLDDRIHCAHMLFTVTCEDKPKVTKLTVAEIEKLLGYKIEIVSEDNK